MTTATRYPLQRSKAKKLVLAGITEGLTDREIQARLEAEGIHVSFQAINAWRLRNPDIVSTAVAKAERSIEDFAIAHKVNRVAHLDAAAQAWEKELQQHGWTWTEETRYGVKRRASAAAAELRATLQQAALELDQLPRAGVTVNNQNIVIVKQVAGSSEELG